MRRIILLTALAVSATACAASQQDRVAYNQSSLVGPPGETGPAGPPGAQGPIGPAGLAGYVVAILEQPGFQVVSSSAPAATPAQSAPSEQPVRWALRAFKG